MAGGIAQLMQDMAAAGAPLEAIVLAVQAIEVRDNQDAERRAKAAERKRTERFRRRQSHDSHATVTGQSDDLPPNDIYSNPPSPPSETKVSSGGKRAKPKSDFELPKLIPAELWTQFEQMRNGKKKPLNDFGRKQLAGKLVNIAGEGWNIEDVMTKAIIGQHDGFWMPDGKDSNIRRANTTAAAKPYDESEYHARLARIGRSESTGPPRPIGAIIPKFGTG